MMENLELDAYKKQTILAIRSHSKILNKKTDLELADLYREWSSIAFKAGWLVHADWAIKAFCVWATTAPCDRNNSPQTQGGCESPSTLHGE